MKTIGYFRPAILAMALFFLQGVRAQVSVDSNTPNAPGLDYVGWDGNTTVPLEVRHNNNQPIEWYTDSLFRMRLTGTLPNQTVNGYTTPAFNIDLSGHLGIGNFGTGNVDRPFTFLHLDNAGSQITGYRPWMRTGMLCTELSDMMYVGTKREAADRIDAVISWADNDQNVPQWGPDALRFIFSGVRDSLVLAGQFNGLEIARMIPDTSGNEGFVGIGNYFAAGLQPTERLDVLDGRVRIRQLPGDPAAVDSFFVMVVDRSTGNERGVVKWVDPADLPGGGSSCEWTMNTTTPNHVYTAFGPSDPDCPDTEEAVGIGVDLSTGVPLAKLNVATDRFGIGVGVKATMATGVNKGMDVLAMGGEAENYGMYVNADGSTVRSRGVHAVTNGASYTAYAGLFDAQDESS